MKQKFLISRFIGGKLSSKLDRKIRRFLGEHHRSHCTAIFGRGKNFKYVHAKMDERAKKKPGKKHRKHGHNIDFISKNFSGDEISAAYIHLLGDFVSDILPAVFENVLKNVQMKKITPPAYLSQNSWDVKKKAMEEMAKKWSEVFINTLKLKKNREIKRK